MTTTIAFLRGINVVGKKMVAMAELKNFCTTLGFTNPRTLLQSGNLLFTCHPRQNLSTLEKQLEEETTTHFKMSVDYFLRSPAELQSIIAHNPFPKAAQLDPSHLVVMFFKQAPEAAALKSLKLAIRGGGREQFSHNGRELYITYPDGIGPSKFTHTLIEKTLARRCTARNWNTILKVAALADK